MRPQRFDRVELARKLSLGKQRVNLAVTNAMQKLGMSPAFAFGHKVVCIALRQRNGPLAQRAPQREQRRAVRQLS